MHANGKSLRRRRYIGESVMKVHYFIMYYSWYRRCGRSIMASIRMAKGRVSDSYY